jgi:signal transduction histidine kinase
VNLWVSPSWPETLSPRAALNLHRTIQEALNNVARHAGARSVEIRLDLNADGECIVSIEDDGRGLEVVPDDRGSSGMLGMTERAVLLGGRLTINGEPGKGTSVRLVVPAEGIS